MKIFESRSHLRHALENLMHSSKRLFAHFTASIRFSKSPFFNNHDNILFLLLDLEEKTKTDKAKTGSYLTIVCDDARLNLISLFGLQFEIGKVLDNVGIVKRQNEFKMSQVVVGLFSLVGRSFALDFQSPCDTLVQNIKHKNT